MKRDKAEHRSPALELVSLFRGLYNRVAQRLGVDPSYVSRVARGERNSDFVKAALSEEVRKIFECTPNRDGHYSRKKSKVTATKKSANQTFANVRKEMARPRFAASARGAESNHRVTSLL